jgi:hypothetical protein
MFRSNANCSQFTGDFLQLALSAPHARPPGRKTFPLREVRDGCCSKMIFRAQPAIEKGFSWSNRVWHRPRLEWFKAERDLFQDAHDQQRKEN